MHLLTSDPHLSLAMAMADLSLNNGIAVIGHADAISQTRNRLIELKPQPVVEFPIISYYKPETYKRAKHRSTKNLKPRKNKMQSKSRRANRK